MIRFPLLGTALLFLLGTCLSLPAQAAGDSSLAQLEKKADTLHLAHSDMWLSLVHYRPDHLTDGYTSQADDPRFFLSPKGKHSPEAELHATLRAIWHAGGGNDSARCRFPARDHWLRNALGVPETPVDCPALDAWTAKMHTGSVTLVFASSYLNNPSSMFGHTFLRLDPPQQTGKADLLLASTVSYAADAGAGDNEIEFAYRGIFGGYPGVTSVLPYYDKVREYSDLENRDLWEYHLNLKPREVKRLLWHTWEIRDKRFDYYFFDENCASRLLELLDVARPGLHLTDRIGTHAIPSDTVRWVEDAGLVDRVHFRPSSATVVGHEMQELKEPERALAYSLATGEASPQAPALTARSPASEARVLIAAYDYIQYMAVDAHWPRRIVAPRSFSLLTARSHLPPAHTTPPPTPAVRPDQGHPTFRASASAGRQDHQNFVQFTLRPAYHDLLDPPEGYRNGAQLQFLRLDGRYYPHNDSVRVERLVGVEIRSLSARNRFFKPISWQVGFGGRRRWIRTYKQALVPYLDGGAGLSWSPGPGWLTTAMATADFELGKPLDKGFHLAPGVDLMALYQSPQLSLAAGVKSRDWTNGSSSHREDSLYGAVDWHLGKRLGLFSRVQRTHYLDRYHTTWRIGIHRYF